MLDWEKLFATHMINTPDTLKATTYWKVKYKNEKICNTNSG